MGIKSYLLGTKVIAADDRRKSWQAGAAQAGNVFNVLFIYQHSKCKVEKNI